MNGWELKYTGSQSLSQSPSFNYHWFCHLIFKTIKFSQQSQLVIWAQLLQNQDFMILIMIKLGSQFVQNILELDNIFQQHSVEILPFSLQGSNCNWNKMLFKCKAFYPEISLLKAFSRWHLKQDYMNLHFTKKFRKKKIREIFSNQMDYVSFHKAHKIYVNIRLKWYRIKTGSRIL